MTPDQIKAAREALNSLDDYARMNTGVNAIGPRGVLESFISEAERTTAPVSLTDDDLTQEFSLDAIIKGIRYADHGRHEGWQAELKEYIRIECNRAILAAAPAPIQQEPTLIAYVATDLDGHYDVGTTPEKAKERAGHGCDTVFPIYDIGMPVADAHSSASRMEPEPVAFIVQIKGKPQRVLCWPDMGPKKRQSPNLEYTPLYATPPALAGSQVQDGD